MCCSQNQTMFIIFTIIVIIFLAIFFSSHIRILLLGELLAVTFYIEDL